MPPNQAFADDNAPLPSRIRLLDAAGGEVDEVAGLEIFRPLPFFADGDDALAAVFVGEDYVVPVLGLIYRLNGIPELFKLRRDLSRVFSAKKEFLCFKTCYIRLLGHSPLSPNDVKAKFFLKTIDIVSEWCYTDYADKMSE